ncbi:DUF3429 domain-containing protein [Paracoccus sediminicola]|uniref:DUF3429 domain-containing protein n=1 Tax=Paracoccus sediminicola TaxID=3017783 RepID=UPI0022F0F37D|nr:DUF3429 domain-containing protein [Paracoccus sediminicola]WBU55524.1 DUF3429 domain-containing protein [Paracoccus sediminicola]
MQIPAIPLILGLAGTLPFLGAALSLWLGTRLVPFSPAPVSVAIIYGQIILSFMSGVIWGFAAKASGARAMVGYVLSVIPALWVLFTAWADPAEVIWSLMAGFAALLLIDALFWSWGLAPRWWMRLRLLLSGIVIAALIVVLLHV